MITLKKVGGIRGPRRVSSRLGVTLSLDSSDEGQKEKKKKKKTEKKRKKKEKEEEQRGRTAATLQEEEVEEEEEEEEAKKSEGERNSRFPEEIEKSELKDGPMQQRVSRARHRLRSI